ncbi:cytochrome P450 [Aspergillus steynii IBT 23096]|uniref:Cytochrome P450 n=1 Tax=Aspergillus steynii IBT 23096 TaxID=1392250 RepID=A0A2I2G700_9EURO|nr:cytochrome P450 [Aspergillus steynii IBT 23096]PLB48659.1 cytochrome P450 [Aspergillus steynii IBT 23096]
MVTRVLVPTKTIAHPTPVQPLDYPVFSDSVGSLDLLEFVELLLVTPFRWFGLFITGCCNALIGLAATLFCSAGFIVFLAGIITHLGFFNRGEWDRFSSKIAWTFLGLEWAASLIFFGIGRWPFTLFLKLSVLYFSGIVCSMLAYRVFFHPLRDFPGPLMSRMAMLWRCSSFETVWNDHRRFGDFVRVGPREVSINNVEAFHQIHGPGAPCIKGPIYECNPERTLRRSHQSRMYKARSSMWAKALGQRNNLNEYQVIFRKHCATFLRCLKANANSPFDITLLLRYFSYDVMGDMVLGRSFGMMRYLKSRYVLIQQDYVQDLAGTFKWAPWLSSILKQAPSVNWIRGQWIKICYALINKRHELADKRGYLFSALPSYTREGEERLPFTNTLLVRDADLAIATGTDTVAYTLSALIFLLATHPKSQRLLRDELTKVPPDSSRFSVHYLRHGASYLNACIKEAIRLYPAIPGGIQRLTPPEGMTVAGRYIPGNMIVSTSIWSMHRDPRYFVSPNEFIPERWTSRRDLVLEPRAFVPFLTGPYRCPGRQFAMLEMQMLVGSIVHGFDFRSGGSHRLDDSNVIANPGPDEAFVLRFPAHAVLFTPRA